MTNDKIDELFDKAEAAVANIDRQLKDIEELLNEAPTFRDWA